MKMFFNLVALLPWLGFVFTMAHFLIVNEEVYINYHWFIVALVSLQASAERLKNVNSVSSMIFISSILANILLLIASGFDLKITPATYVLFLGYLSVVFFGVMGNLAANWYKQLCLNKALKSGS